MKIAVSATGKSLDSYIEEIFGRASYFLIFIVEEGKIKDIEAIKNVSLNQPQGVGIAVAQMIVEKNIEVVITGNVGPRALDVLKQFKIKVFKGSGSIKENLEKFIKGELKEI